MPSPRQPALPPKLETAVGTSDGHDHLSTHVKWVCVWLPKVNKPVCICMTEIPFHICAHLFSIGLAQFYFLYMYIWLHELCMCNPTLGCQRSCAFSVSKLLVGQQEGHLACKKQSDHVSRARCKLAYGQGDATATQRLLLQQNQDWFYLAGTDSP